MLKMADEDPNFFPLVGIVPPSSLPAEIDASGTIFAVKDLPRICEAVFGAWMLLHKQPSCIEKQMASVLEFLDRAKQQKIMPMLPLLADAGVDDGDENLCSSKKRDWDTFKLCLQDADIVPVDLMVTRMMRKNAGSGEPPAALLDFCENRDRVCRRMPCDWQDCKYWFVPHMVRHNADGRTAVQRFTGWGLVDYMHTPFLPPGVGGCEDAAAAGGEDEEVPRLTLEERERKAKAGGPFHALVVDAARKAIENVLCHVSSI